jgi:hypothetical protein
MIIIAEFPFWNPHHDGDQLSIKLLRIMLVSVCAPWIG